MEVARSVFLREAASFRDVSLIGAKIGGILHLRGSKFDGVLDLTGASIGDELLFNVPRLGSGGTKFLKPPIWTKNSKLILRNAKVGALNDTENAWSNLPNGSVDLTGFTYDRLGGLRSTRNSAMTGRSDDWLLGWLGKQEGFDTTYNPQPFEQLAKVLRESGYPDKADGILYAARTHQRDSPETPFMTKALLWVQWGLIGYGYNNWLAVLWFIVMVIAGTFMCRVDALGSYWRRFWYSFDTALPLVDLNAQHGGIVLEHGAKIYFYFH